MIESENATASFQADINSVNRIQSVASILEVVCRTTGMGFAAVARVTQDRWIACAVRDEIQFGLEPGGELEVQTTICNEIRESGKLVVIDNVDEDEVFLNHHTPAMYGFKSYISVPILLKNGDFFGTLCAIDPAPAILNTTHIISMFKLFADLIAFHLNTFDDLILSHQELLEERRVAGLREQFIAILGHDLRNPVGAITNAARILKRMPLDENAMVFANIIQDSSFRVKGLIDNMLDFARGRLGDGIVPKFANVDNIHQHLAQVIAELKLIWPEREIETQFTFPEPINCDAKRIAQLFSNLLGNALTHGKPQSPVVITSVSNSGQFELTVTNYGSEISQIVKDRLFQPFVRGDVEPRKEGLGLGLYIASEIAKAHKGNLVLDNEGDRISFRLTIPCQQQA